MFVLFCVLFYIQFGNSVMLFSDFTFDLKDHDHEYKYHRDLLADEMSG